MVEIALTRKELDEFVEYTRDHVEHFDAVPCEFESSRGTLLDVHQCWTLAQSLGLTVEEEAHAC